MHPLPTVFVNDMFSPMQATAYPSISNNLLSYPTSCIDSCNFETLIPKLVHLHHIPSTLEAYLDLLEHDWGTDQLIDGVLSYFPNMSGAAHGNIQTFLAYSINSMNEKRHRSDWVAAHTEAQIAYASSWDSFCVRADIAVGPYVSAEEAANLSPTSTKVHFPSHAFPPKLVIAVTSGNRSSDLKIKKQLYARVGIP